MTVQLQCWTRNRHFNQRLLYRPVTQQSKARLTPSFFSYIKADLEANRGQETGAEAGTDKTGSSGTAEEVGAEDDPEAGGEARSRNRHQAEEGGTGGRKTEDRGAEDPDAEARRA